MIQEIINEDKNILIERWKTLYYLKKEENEKQYQEIERLNNIIKKLEEFIEREIELYTVELTEKNKNKLSYTAPIRAVYKEIYNVLQELKGSDKE